MDTTDSPLENWIRARNMTTTEFTKMVGCSRPVVWKVKRGIAICPKYARKIVELTKGEVMPVIEPVGRQRSG